MFNTVKIQGDGFLVDGKIYAPAVDGNPFYEEIKAHIANGGAVEPEFTDAELDKTAQETINQTALAYLASTDWYVIRQQETGVAVPQTILDARAEARTQVVPV